MTRRRGDNMRFPFAYNTLLDRHREALRTTRLTWLTYSAALIDLMTQKPAPVAKSDRDILNALSLVSGIRLLLEEAESDLLMHARRRGLSYSDIATALGLSSRQAAEQRALRLERGGSESEKRRRRERQRRRFGAPVPEPFDLGWWVPVFDGESSPPEDSS